MENKLHQMHDLVRNRAESELARHACVLGRSVASVLKAGVWAEPSDSACKELQRTAEEIRNAAYYLDAAAFVADKVLSSKNSRIVDIRLMNDLREAQSQIHEKFASGAAPRRGFVYVSWSRRPEVFYYVGQAGSAARLNLAGHGKLANTVGWATALSLIFPSQSSADTLSSLEASVMALIESHTGELPKLNDRGERVPEHEGTNELESLRRFLEQVARDLE